MLSIISIPEIMKQAMAFKATDIHICCGAPVIFRVARDLLPLTKEHLTAQQSRALSLELLSSDQVAQFERTLDYDTMMVNENGRFRINVGFFNGAVGATIRVLPPRPKTIRELNLPEVAYDFASQTKGLILITGATSQGKTTTIASLIDEINSTTKKHIVTIEDPIEYVHVNKKAIVRQREVGRDTASFSASLRAALRQDPDVIVIGEMRDYETIKIALTAAETGVMVLSTLHIISIDKIIERILSYAPSDDQGHLRYLLADSLQGVLHQELLPAVDGGKRVACEVLVATDAVRHIIRRRGTHFLRDVITTGKKEGMQSMVDSINQLVEDDVISTDTARAVLRNYSR